MSALLFLLSASPPLISDLNFHSVPLTNIYLSATHTHEINTHEIMRSLTATKPNLTSLLIAGSKLTLCQTETSCCSRAVEQRLGAWAERQYRDALQNKTTELLAELDTRATQVDGEDSDLYTRIATIVVCVCRLHLRPVEQGTAGVP